MSVFSLFLNTTGKRVFQTGCLLYLLSAFCGTEICQIFVHLQIVLPFLLYEYKYQGLVKTMHVIFFFLYQLNFQQFQAILGMVISDVRDG